MDDRTLTMRLCEILARLPGWRGPLREDHAGASVSVFYGAIEGTPDQAVGVRVYGEVVSGDDQRVRRRAQLRVRGARNAPDGADNIAGLAHAVLNGLSRQGGINSIIRQSFSPSGADANGREERTENYLIILDNQEAFTP